MATSKKTTYSTVRSNCQQKIEAFGTIITNAAPSSAKSGATATQLNSFSKWIDKGAIVQTCTKAQVSRWAKSKNKNWNSSTASPTSCRNVLSAKFGKSTIKAVCCTKSGSYMVATAPTCKGKNFCFPK